MLIIEQLLYYSYFFSIYCDRNEITLLNALFLVIKLCNFYICFEL